MHLVRYYGYYSNRARGATMRIIALIDAPAAIERILKHIKARDPGPAPIQPSGRDPPWPQGENLPFTYHPVPDIA